MLRPPRPPARWDPAHQGARPRAPRAAFIRDRVLQGTPPRLRWSDILIEREEARRILDAYASSQVAAILKGAQNTAGPLVFLGDEKSPLAHVGTLKQPEDGKSAYHIARAVHEAVVAMESKSITVLMFAYKVIQGVKYQGFMLYHVDEDNTTHTRILDPQNGHHWILDGSEYWRSFPYTFGEGPHEMPAILGHHDESVQAADFDEYQRP